MTLPDERYRAVIQTRQFLIDLLDPKKYPRIPRAVRGEAYRLLRHYPTDWDMQRAADAVPEVFVEKMEPVYRMIRQYEDEKTQNE